jgi:thiol-disulfide isomerase/thioredoxin
LAIIPGAPAPLIDYSAENALAEADFFPRSYPFPALFAIDLPTDKFVSLMAASQRKWFAVAFYAPWSPHSQRFAPRLERVALAYNRQETDVFVGRVDCQAETQLCEHFGITAFPTLYLGTTEEWIQALGEIDRAERGTVDSMVFFAANSTVTVKGHDREVVHGLPHAEACADLCVRRLWCLSFEFSETGGDHAVGSEQPSGALDAISQSIAGLLGGAGGSVSPAGGPDGDQTTAAGACYLQDATRGDQGVRSEREWSDLVYFERSAGALTEIIGSTDFDEHVEEEHPLALMRAIGRVAGETVPLPTVETFRQEVLVLDEADDGRCRAGTGAAPDNANSRSSSSGRSSSGRSSSGRSSSGRSRRPRSGCAPDAEDLGPASFDGAATAAMWYNSTRVNAWDLETAVAESLFYAIEQRRGNPWQEQALEDWTEALCERYPSYGCRESLCGLRRHLPRLVGNATGLAAAARLTREWRLCAREEGWTAYRRGWQQCRGSWPNTRGFPCGLWLLFHTMASTARTALEAVEVLRAVRQYVDVFFGCQSCRRSFATILAKAAPPQTQSDVVMLLWQAHNEINLIVQQETEDTEAEGWTYGDPAFPHVVWPPRELARRLARGSVFVVACSFASSPRPPPLACWSALGAHSRGCGQAKPRVRRAPVVLPPPPSSGSSSGSSLSARPRPQPR